MYKVVVIDDEELLRQGLISKLRKSGFPISRIAEAENAETGLKVIAEVKPHIVLCDIRMEETDGLELIRMAKQKFPGIKTVIISGYNEFQYAAKALKLGVTDYLLKPIDRSALAQCLLRCFELIDKDRQDGLLKKQLSYIEHTGLVKSKLSQIDSRDCDPDEIFQAGGEQAQYRSVYVYIDPRTKGWNPNVFGEVLSRSGRWAFHENVVIFENKPREYAILFCIPEPDEEGASNHDIDHFVTELQQELTGRSIFQYTLGISERQSGFSASYREAVSCIKTRVLLEENQIVRPSDILLFPNAYKLPPQKIAMLKHYTENGDYQGVSALLDEILCEIGQLQSSYRSVQTLYAHLKIIASEEFGFDPEERIPECPGEIYRFDSLREMMDWVKELFLTIINVSHLREHSKAETIHRLKEYIDTHYSDDIKLEEIAELQHYNPSYLSLMFKEVIQMNFQDYLLRVRMNNAKEMLASGKYKIKEIARMSGFKNPHYFSTVFKKTEGLTPKQFVRGSR
ncbi:response regulator [Paenibacillus humicola]|uniref:response regulator n=1 Tax=Paenibacillus humicola TaxID=3110540 RepID=UPI00237B8C54|nr:response regulator [Paenibacillus humicola]